MLLSSSDIAGRLLPVVPTGGSSPVGPIDPAGRHVAIGPVGPFGTLSPSDCHPAGLAGLYVAGGPVGPDGTLSPVIYNHAGSGLCPRCPPVLRSWWILVGGHSFRGDGGPTMFWRTTWCWGRQFCFRPERIPEWPYRRGKCWSVIVM